MNNGDEVGASAVGELIRKNMKVSINKFPAVKDRIAKAHKLETQFLYGYELYEQLWKLVNEFYMANVEWVKICPDLNGTWTSEHQYLFYSIRSNIIGLKSYTMPGNTHSVEDWKPEEQ